MPNYLMIDLQGTQISEKEKAILVHPNVGALILFTRNFKNLIQLKQLVAEIHQIRPDIFVAVDQEGGYVQRFQRNQFRHLPAARVYGDLFDSNPEEGLKLAKKYGRLMAMDLLNSGVDLSLAPVLDLHGVSTIIGHLDRAFHSDPEVVVQLADAFIEGMNEAGMPSVGKHFPGHGSVSADSHLEKPTLAMPKATLLKKDLRPFIDLIHKNRLASVMPAHVTYTDVDADNPAGFSKIWLQDILRNELHFKGLVLSDCLGMTGADIGDLNVRANRALQAGCDMLIVCNQSYEVLTNLLETLRFEQTKESAERIEAFKRQMLRFNSEKKEKSADFFMESEPPSVAPATPKSATNAFNNTTSI